MGRKRWTWSHEHIVTIVITPGSFLLKPIAPYQCPAPSVRFLVTVNFKSVVRRAEIWVDPISSRGGTGNLGLQFFAAPRGIFPSATWQPKKYRLNGSFVSLMVKRSILNFRLILRTTLSVCFVLFCWKCYSKILQLSMKPFHVFRVLLSEQIERIILLTV